MRTEFSCSIKFHIIIFLEFYVFPGYISIKSNVNLQIHAIDTVLLLPLHNI